MVTKQSRIYNTIKNFIYGFGNQIIISLLTFLSRVVFIRQLGMEFLGINGLYTSILTVLSLAELGFGNIVVFSLYKPIAEDSQQEIAALIKFYRKVYLTIACFIATTGVLLIPFLDKIVKTEKALDHLVVYYLLFLANTVVSYLFVYKTSLIRADQKQYIISKYTMMTQIVFTCIQIITLIIFSNYIYYLILQISCTFFINFALSIKANKLYPYLKVKSYNLKKEKKVRIFEDVKAMFSYRMGGIILNSTDNIFISALVSTVSVGIYSNYILVISFVNQFITMFYDAIYHSVGNLNSANDSAKKKEIFNVLTFGFSWIASMCFVCLFELLNPFVLIFFGETLNRISVLAICINFYLPVILYPVWMYRNTTGLFKETKNILLYAAGVNFVLSFILGKKFGISGILCATFISRILTSFWYEPFILFKNGFKEKSKEYFFIQLKYLVTTILSIVLIEICMRVISLEGFVGLIIKGIICVLIVNTMLLIINCKSKELAYIKSLIVLKKERK